MKRHIVFMLALLSLTLQAAGKNIKISFERSGTDAASVAARITTADGTKRSTLKGGIRVPYIVRWPGKVAAGSVNDHQLAFYDVMPTLCEIIGIEDYEKKYSSAEIENDYFDGISFAKTLLGQEGQEEHEFLYWEFHETNMMGLRMKDWKLVVKNGNCSLYDLATDVHEDNDIAAQYPDIVKQMVDVIHREHTNSSMFNVTLLAKR